MCNWADAPLRWIIYGKSCCAPYCSRYRSTTKCFLTMAIGCFIYHDSLPPMYTYSCGSLERVARLHGVFREEQFFWRVKVSVGEKAKWAPPAGRKPPDSTGRTWNLLKMQPKMEQTFRWEKGKYEAKKTPFRTVGLVLLGFYFEFLHPTMVLWASVLKLVLLANFEALAKTITRKIWVCRVCNASGYGFTTGRDGVFVGCSLCGVSLYHCALLCRGS